MSGGPSVSIDAGEAEVILGNHSFGRPLESAIALKSPLTPPGYSRLAWVPARGHCKHADMLI